MIHRYLNKTHQLHL